jgi:hypothetical protein
MNIKRRKNSANQKKRKKQISKIKRSMDKYESKIGGPKLESQEYDMIDFTEYNK